MNTKVDTMMTWRPFRGAGRESANRMVNCVERTLKPGKSPQPVGDQGDGTFDRYYNRHAALQ
jgi:hypothetical protein